MSEVGIVYVVDDDPRLRQTLQDFLAAHDYRSIGFATAADFARHPRQDDAACLILDLCLPGQSGLDFQAELAGEGHPPIIFLTGKGDVPSSVQAMKGGAVDFLTKPPEGVRLLEAVRIALARDREDRRDRADLAVLQRRLDSLTRREREVLPLVVSGLMNKQAAAELGISEITLEIHRRRIKQKMDAASFADLVRMAERLRIPATHSRRGGTS